MKEFPEMLNISEQWNINTTETEYNTSILGCACTQAKTEYIIEILIQCGADVYTQDMYSRSILEILLFESCTRSIAWIISRYPDLINTLETGYSRTLVSIDPDTHPHVTRRCKKLIFEFINMYIKKVSSVLQGVISKDIAMFVIPSYIFFTARDASGGAL